MVGPELKKFLDDYLAWGTKTCGMATSVQAFCNSIGTMLPRSICGEEPLPLTEKQKDDLVQDLKS